MTNTLMNQSVGAHALAKSSGVRKHKQSESEDSDWSDSEESQTLKDNQIRAVWSQVQLEWNGTDHKYHALKVCVAIYVVIFLSVLPTSNTVEPRLSKPRLSELSII